ncbi:MAG: PEP-CTERM sorting domain-containing protein [Armatimonadetes bacterium]|nr:PEP-CTERM sorting domain-containing protein [Armatimonadota bacterium]
MELHWTGPELGIAYDDLEFNSVPEPSALAALGLLSLSAWLRRRTGRRKPLV